MPAKFKPSEKTLNRVTKKYKTTHFYLKSQTVQTLLDAINSDRTKGKHKMKYRNELDRRGVKLVWS